MIPIPPEQTQALRNVLSQIPPKVASVIGCPEEPVVRFLQAARTLVEAAAGSTPTPQFVLLFDTSASAGAVLTPLQLRRHLREGKNTFFVGIDLTLIRTASEDIRLSALSDNTAISGGFAILVSGSYLYYVLAGRVIDDGPVPATSHSARPSTQWRRPFSDIVDLIRDHNENYIAREQGTRYWAKKRERILRATPDTTESIFQLALFWWLKHYVSDSIDVYAEPTQHGQDKTDVVVVTVDGKFVIEVKWLGKNEHNTIYAEGRIQEGLEQVGLYLTNDNRIVWAYLVVYDARDHADHTAPRTYVPTCRHVRCSEPHLIFLESDTPTQIVKKNATRKKR